MTKKENIKDEILIKMKHHLGTNEIAILESVLNETLYDVNIVDSFKCLPSTIDTTNQRILELYELKRSMTLKESTMKEYLITAKEFIRYVEKPLTQITSEDIEYYFMMKKKENLSNTSLNNKRRNLNALFTWMRKNKFILENPVECTESFKETVKPVDYLTAVEVEQLKTGCKYRRDRALLEWLRCTAVRKGEIPYVNINQVDWKTGKVLIYGEKTDSYRTVMLDDVAIKYLREYIEIERGLSLDCDENLFTYCRGDRSKPLGKSGIYAEVRRIAKQSGLNRRVYPHLFRKTVATNIVRRGGNINDAGFYLGHKPEGVTAKHYTHMSEDCIKKIFYNYIEAV